MGRHRFPHARQLWITADSGGSNGPRSRLWKRSLRTLADELDLTLSVCHFPPGTSKWNAANRSSVTRIVHLIASATTRAGLLVKAALDPHRYETAIEVTDEELAGLRLTPHAFHGNWNYTISPRNHL